MENRCPFPNKPVTLQERSDYAMIEESVLENERRGNFIRVYPNENHMNYRKFFEEERPSDTLLFNYIFHNKYKNQPVLIWKNTNKNLNLIYLFRKKKQNTVTYYLYVYIFLISHASG